MTDISKDAIAKLLGNMMRGKAVQFHPSYSPEAAGMAGVIALAQTAKGGKI